MNEPALALSGIRVLEFSHAVMGPMSGLTLADLGAEVIKVEPFPNGDPTRQLKGFGSGFFTFYNRNKKSIVVDIKNQAGLEYVYKMVKKTDVVIENFSPGMMDQLGLGYENLREINPSIVYCGLKGFLSGPYENRKALDEIIQMMTGLAYMTGKPGEPLRVGASILDVLAGSFGVIGILVALRERERTGIGKRVRVGLFETGAFLMGQHLAYSAIEGKPILPMSERVSSWGIYDLFYSSSGELIFIGITSSPQWESFCKAFDQIELLKDERLTTNEGRCACRLWLIPHIQALLAKMDMDHILNLCGIAEIPFAPVGTPENLLKDKQMVEGKNLLETKLPNGIYGLLPGLPIELDGEKPILRNQPPSVGKDTVDLFDFFSNG